MRAIVVKRSAASVAAILPVGEAVSYWELSEKELFDLWRTESVRHLWQSG